MKRAVWLSPRGTTAKRIHASYWETETYAIEAATKLASDPRNSHIDFTVKEFD